MFISDDSRGGSSTSQRQLARRLRGRGHEVEILASSVDSRVVRPLYLHQVDLSTRLRGSRVRPLLLALQRPWGRRLHPVATPDHDTWRAVVIENAFRALRRRFEPDVVVAASIDRVSWRRIHAQLRATGTPSVLYLREAAAIGHLTITGAPPDLLLANAESLARAAREAGYHCEMVPSVVELGASATATTRESVVLVNPIEILGGDRVWAIASARPDIPFELRESNLFTDAERRVIEDRIRDHPNMRLLPFATRPADIYARARLLLVPHRVDNRPRVILEAQNNGIPVVASDLPGLAESVGPGGVLVPNADAPQPWVDAIGGLWDDEPRYEATVEAARIHAARDDVNPDRIVDRFEALVAATVAART